jgi:multidrug efflux pump subunit AcrA (membrane-fusion protein)
MPTIRTLSRRRLFSQAFSAIGVLLVFMTAADLCGQSNNGFVPSEKLGLPAPSYSAAADKPKSGNLPAVGSRATGTSSRSNQTSGASDGDSIRVPYCSIEFVDDIKLPALEAGAIQAINVQEGQFITSATIVGQIDDTIPQVELQRAKQKYSIALDAARDTTSIVYAQKEYELARSIHNKNVRLRKNGSRSESEVQESKFRKEIAQLKSVKASNDREMAFGEAKVELAGLEAVKQRIARHTLRSDYNAYVVQIFKKPQEYVNVGDDVMRLARMDQMWVQASLNAKALNAADAENRPVTVTLQTASGPQDFKGKIDQVSLENVSAEEYQVKIKVQNRRQGNAWLLRPFSQVSMVIHMDQPVAKDSQQNESSKQAQLPVGSF